MKVTINSEYELQGYFARMNRDYYSLDGYAWMLDYFCEPDDELDVIAICGDVNEYGDYASLSFRDFLSDYGHNADCGGWSYHQLKAMDDDEVKDEVDKLVEAMDGITYVARLQNGDVIMMAY